MTPDELREGARRFIDEIFNRRNLIYAGEMLADDFVEHSAPPPAMPTGKTGAIARFKWLLDACDDLRAEILDIVADGRHVAIRARFVGTDTGGVFPGVPATGRPFDIEGIDIASINDDGKFVEHYGILDMKDALEQLGITPNIGGA
jgi:predicted ester cyclase